MRDGSRAAPFLSAGVRASPCPVRTAVNVGAEARNAQHCSQKCETPGLFQTQASSGP